MTVFSTGTELLHECEYCGHTYEEDYYQVHIVKKCPKSPINPDNQKCGYCKAIIRRTQYNNHLDEICLENPKRKFDIPAEGTPPINPSPVGLQKQSSNFRECDLCGITLKEKNYASHIKVRCPKKIITAKAKRKKSSIKAQAVSQPKQKKTPAKLKKVKPVNTSLIQTKRLRCRKCGEIYDKFLQHCPSCTRRALALQASSQCKYCGQVLKEGILNKHIQETCSKRPIQCVYCGKSFVKAEVQKHTSTEHLESTMASHAASPKVLSKKPPNIIRSSFKGDNTQKREKPIGMRPSYKPGTCYHCGRAVMPGSSACYSCGDK